MLEAYFVYRQALNASLAGIRYQMKGNPTISEKARDSVLFFVDKSDVKSKMTKATIVIHLATLNRFANS